ncbi:MAG: PKD domain-containing protein, partial [Thermoplasmatales archaeon]|nr:PKD domain-containing protein [Thermoplasmatales archaeon]
MSKTKVIQILVMALVLVSLFASISIASASNPKAKILIDDYHGTDLGSVLKNELTDRGFEIDVNSDKTFDNLGLGKYDILVVAIPDKEISETEINAVLDFVVDGGGLLLLGESDGVIGSMNDLSENFGIVFNEDTFKDPSNCDVWVYSPNEEWTVLHTWVEHKITKGIESVKYWTRYPFCGCCGCTLSLSGSASALGLGDDDSYSEIYEKGTHPPALAVSSSEGGKIVAYGSYGSWKKSDFGGISQSDNKQLALNVFHYLSDTTTSDPSTTHIFVEVEEGKSAEYIFTLNNIDTMDAENVRLTVDGEAKEWLSLSDNNFDIAGFYSKDVTITIAPPEGTEVRTYNAEMSISSSNAAAYKGKDTVSLLISVKRFNEPPVADAGGDKIVYVDEEVTFDASASSDPDGSIVSYEWDFGDGSTGSGETVTHKYSEQGDYAVILAVTDNDGAKGSDKIFVHVKGKGENHDPVIHLIVFVSGHSVVGVGESVELKVIANDPDGDALTDSWSCDGGRIQGRGSDLRSIIWEAPHDEGTYKISVEVSDGRGGRAKESQNIVVTKETPSEEKPISSEVKLNSINDISIGENLIVTGTCNKEDGSVILVTCKGPVELSPQFVKVENGKFKAIFDTNDAQIGTYIVQADDGDGNIDKTTVNIFGDSTEIPTQTKTPPEVVSVYLHGDKTNVIVGEEAILSLSAVNSIAMPTMALQLILKVPSGMSITSIEFIESGAGMYTATYTVEPGKERHIGVSIKTNQVGKFNVEGDICYYFGGDKSTAESKNVKLPVKVN